MYCDTSTYMKPTSLGKMERRISEIRSRIAELGDMRPGALHKQCRWKDGSPYGAYWHLTWTFDGKSRSEYIPPQCVARLKEETRRYRTFRQLVTRLIDLSIELSKKKSGLAKESAKQK